uniref:Uncharacterized protein n=1 Tax=Arundo donax TaxID=35708 RepID=A0A0A8ZCU4_ARUDO
MIETKPCMFNQKELDMYVLNKNIDWYLKQTNFSRFLLKPTNSFLGETARETPAAVIY